MAKNLYPVGQGIFFNGNRDLDSTFGIVFANIKCPKDIYAPILLTKLNNITIAPTGNFSGYYCTEELKNAIKYGYEVEVTHGYHWETKADIFSNYVNTLYKLRLNFPKSDPRNLICKLLLNSLYGRFGLNVVFEELTFNEKLESNLLHDIKNISIEGETEKYLYSYLNEKNIDISFNREVEISLPIAIFTTAYARINMSPIKLDFKDHLLYTDTDSYFLTSPLPDSMVGKELGKFKLEFIAEKCVFIAPKVYGAILTDGQEIIKIKGSKIKPSFKQLEDILENKTLELSQER
jgi:hypothetical protein